MQRYGTVSCLPSGVQLVFWFCAALWKQSVLNMAVNLPFSD